MKAAAVPIKNQMNAVFVHVRNLKASAQWYFELMGQEADLEKVHSPVCNVPINGTTSLTLDDHSFDSQFNELSKEVSLFKRVKVRQHQR
ncbi:hypothetical protein [Bacillus sp. FJAT-42376]|uniref:hypothetical protein n=1 Tax=Bacillus sp. FJAT-42376 TaxID=2014076 RepID=UPI0019D2F3D1|nr:hypothetical protein [Bacillus sp. FJAT-42376]